MIVFAFPGTGKTTLSKRSTKVVDLELSEIKYDNRSVQKLTKEERKTVRRPLSSPDYRQKYIRQALRHHEQGLLVLVALNMLLPMLWGMRNWPERSLHIFVPHWTLRQEYKQRYQNRGNNRRFIFEVMLVWYPTTIFFWLLSFIFTQHITILKAGENLESSIRKLGWQL